MSKRNVLWLTLGLGAVAIMVAATTAGATHPRPAGATPIRRGPLVPAHNPARQKPHAWPPLAFPSCNPPSQSSTS